MKDKVILIAILGIYMAMLPLVAFAAGGSGAQIGPGDPPGNDPGQSQLQSGQAEDEVIFNVFNTETGEAMEIEGREYIIHVVAAEMPASFESEALKAQAVAAFTYAVNRKSSGYSDGTHDGCELCTDSTHCKAYASTERLREIWGDDFDAYYKKICDAVDEVYGQYLSYDGEPISAVFHSLSSGVTESSADVWGYDYPYLVSVDSSLDREVDGYESVVTVSREEFEKTMKEYSNKCDLEGDPEEWIDDIVRSDAGGVITMNVGGEVLTGGKFRNLFGLRSANFTVKYSKETFTITVHGYGHGVGMSQYGANLMAKEGATYDQILLHYYTGVRLESSAKGIGKFS